MLTAREAQRIGLFDDAFCARRAKIELRTFLDRLQRRPRKRRDRLAAMAPAVGRGGAGRRAGRVPRGTAVARSHPRQPPRPSGRPIGSYRGRRATQPTGRRDRPARDGRHGRRSTAVHRQRLRLTGAGGGDPPRPRSTPLEAEQARATDPGRGRVRRRRRPRRVPPDWPPDDDAHDPTRTRQPCRALRERVPLLLDALARLYPETATALDHADPLQLLVATILSAQCTDERVNLVTPGPVRPLSRPPATSPPPTSTELEALIKSHRLLPQQGEEHPGAAAGRSSSGTAARCRGTLDELVDAARRRPQDRERRPRRRVRRAGHHRRYARRPAEPAARPDRCTPTR